MMSIMFILLCFSRGYDQYLVVFVVFVVSNHKLHYIIHVGRFNRRIGNDQYLVDFVVFVISNHKLHYNYYGIDYSCREVVPCCFFS